MAELNKKPNVILLPLPLQGPINCFLKLSHLLSVSNLDVTLITPPFLHHRRPNLPSLFPALRFLTISDGISSDHPRPPELFSEMVGNFERGFVYRLPELREAGTCLILDGVFTVAGRAAMEMGVPVVYFSTLSPSCLWVSCGLVPKLVDDGYIPFKNEDMDDPVTNLPGSEAVLRRRDLPGVCRALDLTEPYVQLILRESRDLPSAQGHILNTCEKLEGTPLLSELRSLFPNIYSVGPIHSLFKTRTLEEKPESRVVGVGQCGSFWEEDRSCLTWLDAQPLRSVLFVSFGSIISVTVDECTEFYHGLVNSGVRFLWVQRPDSSAGLGLYDEILEGGDQKGRIVTWAPQEEVLAHRAVGGFLTHSGWNSTLESVVEGVPMLCWPKGIDQLVISRFVEEVWKVGIDMKDKCDRVVIEGMVRDLMETRRAVFSDKAKELAKFANEAVEEGGSSWRGLDRLIEDIKFMRLNIP